jgi:hypothetical protein
MLKGIYPLLNNDEVIFVSMNEYMWANLIPYNVFIQYCCSYYEDVVKNEWIRIKDEIVKVKDYDVKRMECID